MHKQDMLKVQTCVLRVNIHCDGCKDKVKKILQKIEGVYSVKIDVEQGKVTVSGNVDPSTLIKKLDKAGKHAEMWGGQKGPTMWNNQFKDIQFDNFKDNKSQKGGKDQNQGVNQAIMQMQMQMQQQNKGLKDVKFQGKDQKSVKFKIPQAKEDDYSDEFDDEFDEDDYEFDDELDDEFDHDFGGHHHQVPNKMNGKAGGGGGGGGGGQGMHGGHNAVKNGSTKGSGGGKKGGDGKKSSGLDMFIKSLTGKKSKDKNGKDGKSGKKEKGGKHNHGGGADKNGGKKGGFTDDNGKNGKNGSKDNGFGGKNDGWGMKGGENFNGGAKKGGKQQNGFDEIDVMHKPGGGGKNMVQMGNFPMGQMGNIPAVHGLPTMGGMNPAHHYGQGMGQGPPPYGMPQNMPPMMMMNQQRPSGHDMYHPMMYARQPPQMSYGPPMGYGPPPPPGDPYTHIFSDENATGCSIM